MHPRPKTLTAALLVSILLVFTGSRHTLAGYPYETPISEKACREKGASVTTWGPSFYCSILDIDKGSCSRMRGLSSELGGANLLVSPYSDRHPNEGPICTIGTIPEAWRDYGGSLTRAGRGVEPDAAPPAEAPEHERPVSPPRPRPVVRKTDPPPPILPNRITPPPAVYGGGAGERPDRIAPNARGGADPTPSPERKRTKERRKIADGCVEVWNTRKVLNACDFKDGVPMFRNEIRIPPAVAQECPAEVPYVFTNPGDGSIASGSATRKSTSVESCGGPIADLRVKDD